MKRINYEINFVIRYNGPPLAITEKRRNAETVRDKIIIHTRARGKIQGMHSMPITKIIVTVNTEVLQAQSRDGCIRVDQHSREKPFHQKSSQLASTRFFIVPIVGSAEELKMLYTSIRHSFTTEH